MGPISLVAPHRAWAGLATILTVIVLLGFVSIHQPSPISDPGNIQTPIMSSDLADPMHTEGLDDYDLLALVPGEWDAIIDAGCNPTEIMSMSIVNVIHNSDRIRRIIYAQNSNGCMFIFRGDGLGKHSIIDAIIDNARKVGWGRWERLGPSTWHCEQASGSYNLKVVVKNKDTGPEYDGSNHDLVLNGQFNQEDPADLDEGTLRGMYLRTISPNILIMSQQPLKAQLPTQATPQPWIKDIPNNAIARGYVRNPDHLPEGTELYIGRLSCEWWFGNSVPAEIQ